MCLWHLSSIFFVQKQSKEGGKVREAMQKQRLDDFSVMGLMGNIDKMSAYLQDHGLQDHLALFECVFLQSLIWIFEITSLLIIMNNLIYSRKLKGGTLIGENMWTQLDPPAIKGNITQIICVVSELSLFTFNLTSPKS